MSTIHLAKALKLKNRLAGRLAKVQLDIQTYNSVLQEQHGKVDVLALLEIREQIVEALVGLKTNIVLANAEIQHDLIRLGEAKSELTFVENLPVRDGLERHDFQNTEVMWAATLKKSDIDARRKKLEAFVDLTQDKIDAFNHNKELGIPQSWLDLAS
ncbi:MAG: hypothetical protein V4719_16270 [Planctomycetota bacterium]